MGILLLNILKIGLFLGLPFGPVGILCIAKTIERGRKTGFVSALGVISVDVIYSGIVFLAMLPISGFIEKNQTLLNIIVGTFVVVIGCTKVFGKSSVNKDALLKEDTTKNLKEDFIKMFLISIPNIFNMATMVALFSASNLLELNNYFGKLSVLVVMIGILIVELIMWFATTFLSAKLGEKITDKLIGKIIKVCGVGIVIFGISMLAKAF